MPTSSAFYTDQYELTMVDAALHANTADTPCVFELFTRRLPGARRYGVVAGTGRFLAELARFRFTETELSWLEQQGFLSRQTLDWLADFRFTGDIYGYPEGELFFPGSPLLTVHAPFAEGVLLETLALSIYNHDSAVATAASRMVTAAAGKPLAEMGSRRTSETSAVAAARAAYIAGFSATSNLEAGRTWQIPTMGTAAHAFTLLHDTEMAAFGAQLNAFGPQTTLLVDTYDIQQGVANAIAAAGTALKAVRIDSGDLPLVVAQTRKQLDELGATDTKITVTCDLDEHTIASLAACPVDNFGVGTSVVTGSGSPTMGMVYKLVAKQDASGAWQHVAKKSLNKASHGGAKIGLRSFDTHGIAVTETLKVLDHPRQPFTPAADQELLTIPLVTAGKVEPAYLGSNGIALARKRHAQRLTQMPPITFSLQRGDPALVTEYV